jgi:hypothetical protein
MRVGLFIPCYMDTFEPEVGIATADIEGVLIHGAQGVRSLTVIVDG